MAQSRRTSRSGRGLAACSIENRYSIPDTRYPIPDGAQIAAEGATKTNALAPQILPPSTPCGCPNFLTELIVKNTIAIVLATMTLAWSDIPAAAETSAFPRRPISMVSALIQRRRVRSCWLPTTDFFAPVLMARFKRSPPMPTTTWASAPIPVMPAGCWQAGTRPGRQSGGVIASTDGGVTWSSLAEGASGPVDFHAMAISRADPKVIYGSFAASRRAETRARPGRWQDRDRRR